MIPKATIQKYIMKLDKVIDSGDVTEAKELQDEILAALGNDIEGLKTKLTNYSPGLFATSNGITVSSGNVDFIKDVRILRARLQVEADKVDDTKDCGREEQAMSEGMERDSIFISHRTVDAAVADMIKDFLVSTGIPNEKIFCSSLPGNDVAERIPSEVKTNLHQSALNILILSCDYYDSAYCLNEAGIAWYLDEVTAIPIGMPEINHENMHGFLNAEYKLRRLSEDGDIAYLYDQAKKTIGGKEVSHSVVTQETKKLRDKYKNYLDERKNAKSEQTSELLKRITELETENRELKVRLAATEDTDIYEDDIYEDGYHEVKNGDGQILKKGQFLNGNLVDGIEYNIIIKVSRGEEHEEPVPYIELKKEDWHCIECGQYESLFILMPGSRNMIEEGLEYFYVVDKKLQLVGKHVKPTFTNFRTLEDFLQQKEPDELEYIKTGERKYSQTDYADIEL